MLDWKQALAKAPYAVFVAYVRVFRAFEMKSLRRYTIDGLDQELSCADTDIVRRVTYGFIKGSKLKRMVTSRSAIAPDRYSSPGASPLHRKDVF